MLESHEGDAYAAGDATVEFTIQSISKPFVYALALEDLGLDAVFARVGAEPSGEPFNAISLEPGTGRPANPLVNAGAILTTSLVDGGFERIARVPVGVRRPPARGRRGGLRVRARDRRPQPRDRAPDARRRVAARRRSTTSSTPTSGSARCSSPRPIWR